MKKIHPTQRKLLNLLKDTINEPLTIRELQEVLNLSSPSVVHHHITELVKKGFLKRNPVNPNDYQVIDGEPENKITYLNLYGLAQCGPKGSILDGNPIDKIPIASQLIGFPVDEAFLVRAKGDSMAPRICDRDLIIARKTSTAVDGAIIVCTNNEEALIKKFHKVGTSGVLISLNQNYIPITVSEDFKVEGIVRSVISYYA